MKALNIFLFCLICGNVFGQEATEKEIKTEVNEVTVFIDKAQITRKKSVELMPGISIFTICESFSFHRCQKCSGKSEW